MKAQTQVPTKTIPASEYRERLVAVQKVLGHRNYKSIYEYEFNETLSSEDSIRMVNFWNFRSNDLKFLTRFEKIASNLKSA